MRFARRGSIRVSRLVKRPFERALHVPVEATKKATVEGGNLSLFTRKELEITQEAKNKVSVLTSDPFLNNLEFSVLIPDAELVNVHPFVKSLFKRMLIPRVPLAGRLQYFQTSWEKMTKDQNILNIIKGFQKKETFSNVKQFKKIKNAKRTTGNGIKGNFRNVEKRSCSTVST